MQIIFDQLECLLRLRAVRRLPLKFTRITTTSACHKYRGKSATNTFQWPTCKLTEKLGTDEQTLKIINGFEQANNKVDLLGEIWYMCRHVIPL